jgi:hypothetical protein
VNRPDRPRELADWGGNVLAYLLVIAVNGMANGVPLGGQTTGEISDKYPSLFTPAGYVFSIWGLIYLGLAAFAVWQALPRQRTNEHLAAIRLPYLVSCASNAGWIFAWHYDQLVLSMLLMLTLLAALVTIYRTLDIGRSTAPALERWLTHLPFSVYAGWIAVATVANLSAIQIHNGWDDVGLTAVTWTMLKIALVGAVAVTVLFRRRDAVFALVAVWAAAGIAVKHGTSSAVGGAALTIAALGVALVTLERVTRTLRATSSR